MSQSLIASAAAEIRKTLLGRGGHDVALQNVALQDAPIYVKRSSASFEWVHQGQVVRIEVTVPKDA